MREFNKTFIYYKFNLMFTILNVINYFTGKYIPIYLLILITIGTYFYVIYNGFDSLINGNIIYIIMLLLIMLVDITSLIIIFTTDFNNSNNYNNVSNIKIIKKKSKKHNKKIDKEIDKKINRKKDSKKNIKNLNNNCIIDNVINLEKNTIGHDEKPTDKDIISLYDNEKDISLKTYHLI